MSQPTVSSPNALNPHHQPLALMALFEEDFSIDWVQEISDMKATEILLIIDEFIESGQLEKKGPGVFRFKNDETRRELTASLSPEEKERWHRSIAGIFFREMLDENHAVLAASGHLLHLSNDEKGCRQLFRAGEIYRKTYRHQKALQCYQKIIDDLEKNEIDDGSGLFADAVIAYSKIVEIASDIKSIIPLLRKAILNAQNRNDDAQTALLQMYLAKNEWFCSNYNAALRHFNQGWSLVERIDDPHLRRSAIFFSTFFLYTQGRLRDVIQNYEEVISDIDRYPKARFSLLSAQIVAVCYAYIGQIERGMGMLNAIYDQCRNTGDFYVGSYAGYHIGRLLIEFGRFDEAIRCLEVALDQAVQASHAFAIILNNHCLALAYYRSGDTKKSVKYLKEFFRITEEKGIISENYIYLNAELILAMDLGEYPVIGDKSFVKEISRAQKSKNILLKGTVYRYRSMLEERKGLPQDRILRSLQLSEKWLARSGHEIQLARTRMELARVYLSMDKEKKAKEVIKKSSDLLDTFLHDQVPDNLRFLLKDLRTDKNLLKEIMKIGQELVTIRNDQHLVRHILSTVNQITGAERGAVFLLNEDTGTPEVVLRAARNLTAEDISKPEFSSSMKMIKEAVQSGIARFRLTNAPLKADPLKIKTFHSCLCVPMKLREKVVGVLYVDNRIFRSAFKETDIKILDFFSAQAAIALDNARVHKQNRELIQKLEEEKRYLEEQQNELQHSVEFIGESQAIKQVMMDVGKVASTDTTVLILGETGVGKELIANTIHHRSARNGLAFVRVNCSTFPETLVASELFGHEKGAFTGADKKHIGRFELADGGTLFLDEIGDISLEVQVRLLRILQNKEFERVGGRKTLRSDFRLIAATNRDLRQDVGQGKFREDLYYRLNVLSIKIPPLRDRKGDIPLFVDYFLARYAEKLGKSACKITESGLKKLTNYDWPGNVRELENIIERGIILSSGTRFKIPELNRVTTTSPGGREAVTLVENERRHILWALKQTRGKVRGQGGAAEFLDINHNTLFSRMKKLGIRKSSQRNEEFV